MLVEMDSRCAWIRIAAQLEMIHVSWRRPDSRAVAVTSTRTLSTFPSVCVVVAFVVPSPGPICYAIYHSNMSGPPPQPPRTASVGPQNVPPPTPHPPPPQPAQPQSQQNLNQIVSSCRYFSASRLSNSPPVCNRPCLVWLSACIQWNSARHLMLVRKKFSTLALLLLSKTYKVYSVCAS